MSLRCVVGFLLASLSLAAVGQTKWPDFMPTLQPGLSQGPAKVELPVGLTSESADPAIAPAKAAWLGTWRGWACVNKVCDVKMLVERVTNDGATLHYGFASARVNPSVVKMEGRFNGDELHAQGSSGATMVYRMRSSGEVEFLWRNGDQWAAGILSKDK